MGCSPAPALAGERQSKATSPMRAQAARNHTSAS